MTVTFVSIGCCIAAAMLVCCLTTGSRNESSHAAPVAVRPNKRFLLKFNPQVPERAWGVGLTKFDAENLLDWLEANGRESKLTFVYGEGFTVQ